MSDKGVLQFSSKQARTHGGAPAAAEAILVPSWQRARDLSCSALLAGEMCVVVTGLPGTGKTLLMDTVARALRSTGWTVVTFAARLPSEAEFARLMGSAAILIDDADRLSASELRTLNRFRQCSVLLTGAVGFEKRCPADSRVTLAPLPPDEVAIYVDLWLEQAGLSAELVSEAATTYLADVSGGIARVLGILLTDALRAARADGSDQIEEHHIDRAAWRHVEQKAARRLNRADPAGTPESATRGPARLEAALQHRLSQAPFADPPRVDEQAPLLSSRALAFAGVGLAAGLVAATCVVTAPQWWPWAVSAFGGMAPAREAPQAFLGIVPATRAVSVEPPVAAEIENAPSAPSVVVDALPAVPAPAIVSGEPRLTADVESAPVAPSGAVGPMPPAVIEMLNARGREMIELNDYSAARLLFGRAAEAGSVSAMLAIGRSYDPAVIGSPAAVAGVDPVQAAQWYRKAAALGSSDAAIQLLRLERASRE